MADWQEVQMFTNEMAYALRQGIRDGLADSELLTKREQFAMAALQGLLSANPDNLRSSPRTAVLVADALIAELAVAK